MKKLRFLFYLTFWACTIPYAQAQNTPFKYERIPLVDALDSLKESYGVTINYCEGVYDKKVTLAYLADTSLQSALKTLLFGTELTYSFIEIDGQPTNYSIRPGRLFVKKIQGTIRDPQRTPLEGIIVGSLRSGKSVISDSSGYYEIATEKGDVLTYARPGCSQSAFTLDVKSVPSIYNVQMPYASRASFYIGPGAAHTGGREVVQGTSNIVISEIPTNLDFQANGRKFTFRDIQNVLAISPIGEADVMRAFSTLPGIQMTNESVGNLNIRGGAGDQNLILLDEIPLYYSEHMFGLVGMFNHRAVENPTVIPGHFGVRYGRRASSVIDVKGRASAAEDGRAHYGYGASLLSMSMSAEVPLGKKSSPLGALHISGRRSFADLWFSPLSETLLQNRLQKSKNNIDAQVVPNPSNSAVIRSSAPLFNFQDLNLKATVNLGQRHALSLTGFTSGDWLNYQSVERYPDSRESFTENIRLSNQGASLIWSSDWKVAGKDSMYQPYSRTALAYANFQNGYTFHFETTGSDNQITHDHKNQIEEYRLYHLTEWRLDSHHRVEVGLEWSDVQVGQRTSSEYVIPHLPVAVNIPDSIRQDRGYLFSHFGDYTFYTSGYGRGETHWELNAGLRHTYFNMDRRHYWEPRTTLARVFENGLRFQASWGRYYQFVNQVMTSLVPYQINVGNQLYMLADGDALPALRADQWLVGGSFNRGKGDWDISMSAELYQKTYQNLSTYGFKDPANEVFDNKAPVRFLNGQGRVRGADFLLKGAWRRFYEGWVSYSLSQATNQFDQVNDGVPFLSDTDQRHQISVVNTLKLGRESSRNYWVLSSNWTYASGRNFTPLDPTSTGGDPDGVPGLDYAAVNSQLLPEYHRLDIGCTYIHSFGVGKKIPHPVMGKIGVVVYNAYNRVNVSDRIYRLSFSESAGEQELIPVAIDQTMLGMAPNLIVSLEF